MLVMLGAWDYLPLLKFLVDLTTELQCKVLTTFAVVDDKAGAWQSAISQLTSEYSNIAQFRCGTHSVKLVLEAVMKSVRTTTTQDSRENSPV